MPKDVTLLLLAQDHTDTDWSKQMSSSIPELHKSLKGGKKMVICTEQGAHVSAEGMMTYNAQMVAEIRVSQAAKLKSEKALTPGEFQKRVEDFMRKELKVEPEKSFKPYLLANDLDTFLKTPNLNLPPTFHGREDAYLAELELFRYAQTNKIPVVGIDTGRGVLANSGVPITDKNLESVEHSRIEAMSSNALNEMGQLSDGDGGVVVMVNLGRAHMTSLETMVNERVEASRRTNFLKVKTLAGITEGEQINSIKDVLNSSPVNIQNTTIAEMQQSARTHLGESGKVAWNLGMHRRDPDYAKGVLAICDNPQVETERIDRELNQVLDQTFTSLGVDAQARQEMKLNTTAMKLAFVKAVKEATDPTDNFSSLQNAQKKLESENYKELWGGRTSEQVEQLLSDNYEAYEKLEDAYNERMGPISKHLSTATNTVAPKGQVPFNTLKEKFEKAQKLENLSQAGPTLKSISQENRQKLADQIDTSLEKIDFSNRTLAKVANLENNPNCKLLNSKDGASIKKEFQSIQPTESVRTALQNEGVKVKESQVDVKLQVTTGGSGGFKL